MNKSAELNESRVIESEMNAVQDSNVKSLSRWDNVTSS